MNNEVKFFGELIEIKTLHDDVLSIEVMCNRSDGYAQPITTIAKKNTRGLNLESMQEGDIIGFDATYHFIENVIPTARYSVVYCVKEFFNSSKVLDMIAKAYKLGNISEEEYLEKSFTILEKDMQ